MEGKAAFQGAQGRRRRSGGARGEGDVEFHFDGTGFSDFFEQFFGRGSRFDGANDFMSPGAGSVEEAGFVHRGRDFESDILVTLEEALAGSERTISLQRVDRRTGQTRTQTLKVRIPPGVHEGQPIRVAGMGEDGIGGGAAGDLYLRVRFAAHPEFSVRGSDLYYGLDLAPWEAVLGTRVIVPTLKDQVSMRIPAGTNPGPAATDSRARVTHWSHRPPRRSLRGHPRRAPAEGYRGRTRTLGKAQSDFGF